MKKYCLRYLFEKIIFSAVCLCTVLFVSCIIPYINYDDGNASRRRNTESKGTLEIKKTNEYPYSSLSYKIKIGETYKFRISFPDWSPIPTKVDVWYEGASQVWKKDVPVVEEYSNRYVTFTVDNIEPHKNYKFYVKVGDVQSNSLESLRIYQKDQSIDAELISSYEKEVKFKLTFNNYDKVPSKLVCYSLLKGSDVYQEKEASVVDGIAAVDLSELNDAVQPQVVNVYFCDRNCDVATEWVNSNEIEGIILKPQFYIYAAANKDNPDSVVYGYRGKNQKINIEFYDFETAPDKVDVFKDDEILLTDVAVENGSIQFPVENSWSLRNASYFTLKSGEYESNKLKVKIRDYVTLEENKKNTYVGDDFVFKLDCGGLDDDEIPEKINITIKQRQGESNEEVTVVDNEEVALENLTVTIPTSYEKFESGYITVTATVGEKSVKQQVYTLEDKMFIKPDGSTNYNHGQTNIKYTVSFYGDWEEYPEKLYVYVYRNDTNGKVATGTVTMTKGKGTMTFSVLAEFDNGSYYIYAATTDGKYRSQPSSVTIGK